MLTARKIHKTGCDQPITTIQTMQRIPKKVMTLLFGYLILLILSLQTDQNFLIALVVNIPLLIVAILGKSYVIKKIEAWTIHSLENRSVIVLEAKDNGNSNICLWLTRTQEDWPPLQMELSIDKISTKCEKLGTNSKKAIDELLECIQDNPPEELEKIRRLITEAGATHPIDIRFSDLSPTSTQFFENLLLK
jgi:hypothetical protein